VVRRAATVVTTALISGLSFAADRVDVISFEAPAECGGADAFAKRVGGNAGRPIEIAKDAAIRVRITRATKGFHGTLRVNDEGATTERAVDGKTCAEVVDALALVTSMALEEVKAAEPAASVSVEPAPSASAAASSAPPIASSAPPVASSAPVASNPPTARATSRWAVASALDLVVGDGTPLRFGGSLHAEWSRENASWRPSIRLGISHFGVEREPVEGSTVSLGWTLGELGLCPQRIDLGPLRTDVCAIGTGGVLAVSSEGLTDSSSPRRSWFAVGVALRSRIEVGAGFFLEARVASSFPITRDRLIVTPGLDAYQPAFSMLIVGLGVGWYFP
jgi:hypothetical protein